METLEDGLIPNSKEIGEPMPNEIGDEDLFSIDPFWIWPIVKFGLILFAIFILNVVLFIRFAWNFQSQINPSFNKFQWFFAIAVFVVSVGYTIYRGYITCVVEILEGLFRRMEAERRRLCFLAVENIEVKLKDTENPTADDLKKWLNLNLIFDSLIRKLPKILARGVRYLLRKVPALDASMNLMTDITNGRLEEATEKLHSGIASLMQRFFDAIDYGWVKWVIILDLILMLGVKQFISLVKSFWAF